MNATAVPGWRLSRKLIPTSILLIGFALTLTGCSSSPEKTAAKFECPGKNIELALEVASTVEDRAKGLMFRKSLDPNSGMLFIFEEESKLSFWMKNTFIPLDMIFLDKDRAVVGIVEKAAPLTESPRFVEGNSQYVVELFGGESKRLGIEKGCKLLF